MQAQASVDELSYNHLLLTILDANPYLSSGTKQVGGVGQGDGHGPGGVYVCMPEQRDACMRERLCEG